MQVTDVNINLSVPAGKKFKGYARIVLDGVLMVSGIRLFEDADRTDGKAARYIRFPDRQPSLNQTGGEFVSVAVVNTTDEELRANITNAVFQAYDNHPKFHAKNAAEVMQ